MDIRCPICAEPWDTDTLHDETSARYPDKPWLMDERTSDRDFYENGKYFSQSEYEKYWSKIRTEFQKNGCAALSNAYGGGHNVETIDKPRNSVYAALMELAGDDIDFAASMVEDAESYGLFNDE